jgi:exopolysaccharide biosynthesis protein
MHTRFLPPLALLLVLALLPLSGLAAADVPLERTVSELPGYQSDSLDIQIAQHQWTYKKHRLTFFVVHATLAEAGQLRTAFARDTYHKKYTEDTLSIAERNAAVLAVNGDYYNHSNQSGVVLRNGELYRNLASSRDLLWIDRDGALHAILKSERSGEMGEALLAQGAVQAFEFGPALVRDGAALTLPDKYFLSMNEEIREPRTAIGWVDGLHYVFVVADGRRREWSDKGMTLTELQDVLLQEGCQVAYNLDGGGSATLYFRDEVLNQPAGGSQRKVSDIVLLCEAAR